MINCIPNIIGKASKMQRAVKRLSTIISHARSVRFVSSSQNLGEKHDVHAHAQQNSESGQQPLPKKEAHGVSADPIVSIAESLGLSVGLERYELFKDLQLDEDPFTSAARLVESKGSEDKPTLVLSSLPTRMIACACTPDSKDLRYLVLTRGKAQRCNCGNWFALCTPDEYHKTVKDKRLAKGIAAH